MGIKTKGVATDAVIYTPGVDGNREDPAPVRVEFVPMTLAETQEFQRRRLSESMTIKRKRGQNFAVEVGDLEAVELAAIREKVLAVWHWQHTHLGKEPASFGLKVAAPGSLIEIQTGEELADALARADDVRLWEWAVDIAEAISNASHREPGLLGE